jgi:hypothetical protein
MEKLLVALFFIGFLHSCTPDGGGIRAEFTETFPMAGTQTASKLLADAQGVHIIATTATASGSAMLLMHTDPDGKVKWTRTYADGEFGEGMGIARTAGGGFLLVGSHRSGAAKNILIVRTDREGLPLAQFSIGGQLNDLGRHIAELPDGTFMVLGMSSSSGPGPAGMFVARLSAGGEVLWSRGMGGVSVDGGSELLVTDGFHVMLLGFTESLGPGQRDLWLQTVSVEGDSLWSSFYGGPAYEESQAIARTADGGYVLCGHSASLHPIHTMHGLRLDQSGNVLWERHFGSATVHEGGEGVAVDPGGNILFAGRGDVEGLGEEIFLVVTDADGNTLHEERTGGPGDQWAMDAKCVDGAWYILANTSVGGEGDVMLLKRAIVP